MDVLRITGGRRLAGSVPVSGAKNAALPILAATLLAGGDCLLADLPELTDVRTMAQLLGALGVDVRRQSDGQVATRIVDARPTRAPRNLVRRMRASFCVLGPLLARRGRAVVPLPGGCLIGPRPIDVHLRGLQALGAEISICGDHVIATASRLRGATIDLLGPHGPTVTGTANVLTAAVLATGRSVLLNAAREPEIVDLGEFLQRMGAKICGLGTSAISIEGVTHLQGATHRIIPDRIEAATLLMAGAITEGEVTVHGISPDLLECVLSALRQTGAQIESSESSISLRMAARPRAVDLVAEPFPGFPTDLQAQWLALMSAAQGRSVIADRVFTQRWAHARQLAKLGARIERQRGTCRVTGVAELRGATVQATDLRASAALVLAGLSAVGQSEIRRPHHLDRGYQRLEEKLSSLGAMIERVQVDCPGEQRWRASVLEVKAGRL